MSEPFLGEIRMVGFTFAPQGWALCNGQIMSISQNTALFSLLGTTYGGNGQTTFALPDLRGRVPVHAGQGPGLTNRTQGELSGEENHTLISTEMPAHNHVINGNNEGSSTARPGGAVPGPAGNTNIYAAAPDGTSMNQQMVGSAGGSQPHNNMQPYLVVNFIIATQGIYPSRS